MTNSEFREWLRGFFELSPEDVVLTGAQLETIINHLNLAEAVEGHLDVENARLRQDIRVSLASTMPHNHAEISADIRTRILSA